MGSIAVVKISKFWILFEIQAYENSSVRDIFRSAERLPEKIKSYYMKLTKRIYI